MISLSHWGMFEHKPLIGLSWSKDGVTFMPDWWAGSAAYQALNFGPFLS